MAKRRGFAVVSLLAVGSLGLQTAQAVSPPSRSARSDYTMTLTEMGEKFGANFSLAAPPAGQTPEQRLAWLVNERPALGRTPAQWTAAVQALPALVRDAHALAGAGAAPDLALEVIALDQLAGAKLGAGDRSAIAQAAAALPAAIRAPFAQLVATVRATYAAQIPLAATVNARVAAIRDFDGKGVVTIAERDAMLARQQTLAAALGSFRAATAGHLAEFAASGRSFADPAGLVILGGNGNDTYERAAGMFPDPILLVDPDGTDTYHTSAGGACPVAPEGQLPPSFTVHGHMMDCNSLVLAVTADLGLASDDVYGFDGSPSAIQGAAGPGALGLLADLGGNDHYTTKMTRGNVPTFPTTYWDGGSQGFGYGGVGIQIDTAGDDVYDASTYSTNGYDSAVLSQGFGGGGGAGLSIDVAGADQWINRGLGQIGNRGFQGIYSNGTGLFGGVGVQVDAAGNDSYWSSVTSITTDYYAQGFGAFGGLGILFDVAGDDHYFTQEVATAPYFGPQLNCAYGTASFAGVGVMIDHSGNDYYEGDTNSPRGAHVMDWGWGGPGAAFGAFADFGGNDVYNEHAESTSPDIYYGGFGYYEFGSPDPNDPFNYLLNSPGGANVFGVFVDIGGTDSYTSPHDEEVANNSVWAFGVDHD